MNKVPDFVARRLNSIIKQIDDIQRTNKIPSFERAEIVWNAYAELHQNMIENMEGLDEFFPVYKQHNAGYSEDLLELTKTRVREIADHCSITLDIDQKKQSSPIMTQYQISNQVNLQTVNNVIECINSLDIKLEQKTQLVELAKEFEKAAKDKDSGKLKSILKQVGKISPKVAGFLLEHAAELGLLTSIL